MHSKLILQKMLVREIGCYIYRGTNLFMRKTTKKSFLIVKSINQIHLLTAFSFHIFIFTVVTTTISGIIAGIPMKLESLEIIIKFIHLNLLSLLEKFQISMVLITGINLEVLNLMLLN